jgi:hypothetical protein
MHASNKPQAPEALGDGAGATPHAMAVRAMWDGAIGCTVRCVPTRRTVVARVGDEHWFGKWRTGRRRSAAAEWHWLHVLPMLGLRTPSPIAWLGSGRRTLLITAALPGRALDAWAIDAHREGWLDQLVAWACANVAPAVRTLHARGLVYRDLYWNHVFADDPLRSSTVSFLDVERVFHPRWRRRRWIVKDLAGLLSSLPVPVSARGKLRFLRACLQQPLRDSGSRWLLRAIVAKAARIARHAPRYG